MLGSLKIRNKLMVGFGICLVFLMAIVATASYSITKSNKATETLAGRYLGMITSAYDMQVAVLQSARHMRNALILEDNEKIKKEIKDLREEKTKRNDQLTYLSEHVKSEEGKKSLGIVKEIRASYIIPEDKFIELVEAGKLAEAKTELLESVRPLQLKYIDALGDFVKQQRSHAKAKSDDAITTGKSSLYAMVLLGSIAAVLSLLAATIITRRITGPLREAVSAANALAEGDLRVSLQVASQDETGELMLAMKTMSENLRNIIGQVSQTANEVSAASSQLHATAETISTGAEEVASQTSTVATASEEMSATSGDIAHSCLLAAETSNRASETARGGAEIVKQTIGGMERIAHQVNAAAQTVEDLGKRSEQIGEIIGTIEDIADQTNLLALNAAIEAARAGEQGRGFAVVADEVRALAERTTRATREIGEMIKAIQGETRGAVAAMENGVIEVNKGTEFSRQSGEALEMILVQINDVTAQVNQIATAAEEQTATTSEITSNIQQITTVVHSTSQGATETAAASAQLSREAEHLQQLVHKFKV
jgi:methyl-accepting chemotaxis protein